MMIMRAFLYANIKGSIFGIYIKEFSSNDITGIKKVEELEIDPPSINPFFPLYCAGYV